MTTTYLQLKAYLQALAENHSGILDTDTEKHFFHSNLDQILSGLSSRVNFPAVFMADYDYSFTDNNSDNHQKRRALALVFIDHSSEADAFDAIAAIYSQMEEIADDWINRIYNDKLERRHAFLKDFELNDINAVQFSAVDNNFGIWLPIMATTLHDISIDTDKWTDL